MNPRVFPEVMRSLLRMLLEITPADVVFYRELRGETLCLVEGIPPIWRDEEKGRGLRVPEEKKGGEGLSTRVLELLRNQVHKGDTTLEARPLEPLFEPDTRRTMKTLLEAEDRWSFEEREFFQFIKSELCIPVVIERDRTCGIVVAISNRPGALSRDLADVLRRFAHISSLWAELGRLYDGRAWWDRIPTDIVDVLPLLASAPSDEAFFSGLATILTAHNGLCWNRALLFSCNSLIPGTAELVYALGGTGPPDSKDEAHTSESKHDHWEMIKTIEHDDRVRELRDIVSMRMESPLPHWTTDDGEVMRDALYEQCIEVRKRDQQPIQIHYGPDAPKEVIPVKPGIEDEHPLRWMLEADYCTVPSFQIPVELAIEGWLQKMNEEVPGIFCAPRMYAFPLWCLHDESKEPLGIVLVDMAYMPHKPLDEIIPTTRVVLDLVSEILISRYEARRLRGSSGWFMHLRHGGNLKEAWDSLHHKLRLLRGSGAPDDVQEVKALVAAAMESAGRVDLQVKKNLAALKAIRHRVSADQESKIEDLGEFLDEMVRAMRTDGFWAGVTVEGDTSEVTGYCLPCDPLIVIDAIHCLFRNAMDATRRVNQEDLTIRIEASLVPSKAPVFAEIVTIEISNSGPPIAPAIADCLFLDGFHFHPGTKTADATAADLTQKGRGLPVARSQLSYYHGDLQLVRLGEAKPWPRTPKNGPAFAIRFGIPAGFNEELEGVTDVKTTAGL